MEASVLELPALHHAAAWDAPIPFDDTPPPEISAQLLPGIFGQWARELAFATETAESLTVMAILGVTASILSPAFRVSPKRGWLEPLNLYVFIALPPANHKSLVLNYCTQPLIAWEKSQAAQLEPQQQRQRSEHKTLEKIIDSLRTKAAHCTDPHEQAQLIETIRDKEAQLPKILTLPIVFTNDATPEALTQLVYEQKGHLGIFSDEGGILETLSGLYNRGSANVDILLKGIDGGEVRVQRKDRRVTLNPYLTVLLMVQPAILHKLGNTAAYSGNGTLERFLYVLPQSQLGYRTHTRPPIDLEIHSAYCEKITALLNQFQNPQHKSEQTLHTLVLDTQAYHVWHTFQQYIETELRPDGRLSHCLGWGGKISGFCLRLAGLLHVMNEQKRTHTIDEQDMRRAVELAKALVEHALAAFAQMGTDKTLEDAKTLLAWIQREKKRLFSQSEVTLAMRNKKHLRSAALRRALRLLQERNWISQAVKVCTRKPTLYYYVNPRVE